MRCRLAVVGLVALLPLGALVGWWCTPEPLIGEANFNRIEIGMSDQDVRRLLGSDGEDFGYGERFECSNHTGMRIWHDGRNTIIVNYTRDRVTDKSFFSLSFWEYVENWLHGRTRDPRGGRSVTLKDAA